MIKVRLVSDEDGHTYLIPETQLGHFYDWLKEEPESTVDIFSDYRVEGEDLDIYVEDDYFVLYAK